MCIRDRVQTDPYDICFYGWTGDNGDPDNFMNLLADTNWSMNVAHFQDDEYKAVSYTHLAAANTAAASSSAASHACAASTAGIKASIMVLSPT